MVGGGRGAGHLLSGSWDFRLEGPASFSSLHLFSNAAGPFFISGLKALCKTSAILPLSSSPGGKDGQSSRSAPSTSSGQKGKPHLVERRVVVVGGPRANSLGEQRLIAGNSGFPNSGCSSLNSASGNGNDHFSVCFPCRYHECSE